MLQHHPLTIFVDVIVFLPLIFVRADECAFTGLVPLLEVLQDRGLTTRAQGLHRLGGLFVGN